MDIYGRTLEQHPMQDCRRQSGVRLRDMSSSDGSVAGKSDPNPVQDWTYTTEIHDGSYLVKHLRTTILTARRTSKGDYHLPCHT